MNESVDKTRKIKVCHVVSGLRAGGVESMIYNYCSRMNASRFDFSILYQHEPSQKNIDDFEKINFKLIRVPNKRKRPVSNFIKTYSYLKSNRIDVVHCHMTLMNIFPLLAAKIAGVKKRICHSHGFDLRKKNFIIKIIEQLIKKACIGLSTDLYACGEDAGKYLYGDKKIKIINNALIIPNFQYSIKNRKIIRRKYNFQNNERVILHVGRFEEQKNHIFLVKFMEKILKNNSNYRLVLVGDGPLRGQIEKLVKIKNIPNIIFTGIVSNVNEYYSACDLFILPSVYEGLPVSALEAQVSGVKCLLSKNIDPNVIVISENVELIENNIEEWKKAVIDDNNYGRHEDINKFDEKNLNINIEYKKLEREYLSVWGGLK